MTRRSREPRQRQWEQRRSETWQTERELAAELWRRKEAMRRWARLGPHTCPKCGEEFSHPKVFVPDKSRGDTGDTVLHCPMCGSELRKTEHKGRIARLLDRLRLRSRGPSDKESSFRIVSRRGKE
jgi:uncharacterized Zn-finger protein